MRLLVATDQWWPDVVGGSARVAADTAAALARRGHELVVLAPTGHEGSRVDTERGIEVYRVLRRGVLPQTFSDPREARRAARRLSRRPFDLLVGHQTTTGLGLARAFPDIPLASVFHASAVLEMQFLRRRVGRARGAAALALHPALVRTERAALERSSVVLVLSRYSEALLREHYPATVDRIRVVGGGVDVSFFDEPAETQASVRQRLGVPPDGVLLMSARRLEPRMGLAELISALAGIDDERFVLAIAGDGLLRDDLTALVRRLGLGERVRLLGRVPEAELRALYAAADLFVLPTVAYEGFGMSTVEALAQGTPVLGTRAGATPEILGGLGPEFVMADARPETIAAGIRRVLPLLGARLRQASAALARGYSWDVVIEGWETALRGAGQKTLTPGASPLTSE